jgi:hypothetical protein
MLGKNEYSCGDYSVLGLINVKLVACQDNPAIAHVRIVCQEVGRARETGVAR